MRTNYLYHAISGVVFLIIGCYFLFYPQTLNGETSAKGIQTYLPWVILIWGGFKLTNAYLLYQKKQKES